jgi:hypothetical protein
MIEEPDRPEQPFPPHMRSFSMNSREFYEAVCEPHRRNSWGTPVIREGGPERVPDTLWVSAANGEDAGHAVGSWLRNVVARNQQK